MGSMLDLQSLEASSDAIDPRASLALCAMAITAL